MNAQTGYYHKNTPKNIRSANNRPVYNFGRSVDIVRDKEFKPANKTLDGILKKMTQIGTSSPTKHKEVIHTEDLSKISSYLRAAKLSPPVLRLCIWYHLSIQFVSCNCCLEFHKSDTPQFIQLTAQNTSLFLGGNESKEAPSDKRMYSSPK